MSLKEEPCMVVEASKEKMAAEIKEEKPEEEGDDESTPDEYSPTPYQFNTR